MTKEALKLALEALETLMIERGSIYEQAITAIKESLEQPEPNYKKALEVWLDKTEWVQKTVKPHELGMHRADVLKQRVEEALAQPEQDVGITRYADISVGKIIHNSSPPQRTWVGLTKEERHEISMANRPYCADVMAAHEEELKRRNT